jgi:hypothetical protein
MASDSVVIPDPAVLLQERVAKMRSLARVELVKLVCDDITQANSRGLTRESWIVKSLKEKLFQAVSSRDPTFTADVVEKEIGHLLRGTRMAEFLVEVLSVKYRDCWTGVDNEHPGFCGCLGGTEDCQESISVSWK